MELAANRGEDFRALSLESAFSDVLYLLALFQVDPGPHAERLSKEFSNNTKLAGVQLPVLILHGDRDQLLQPLHARENHEAIPHENKAIVWMEGAGHNDMLLQARMYFAAIRGFVKTLPEDG